MNVRLNYPPVAPTVHLTLERESHQNWIVVDGDTVYLRSPDRALCVRFILAMVAKRQATFDEASIGWIDAHSVRVPDNVIPLRRPLEATDEAIA